MDATPPHSILDFSMRLERGTLHRQKPCSFEASPASICMYHLFRISFDRAIFSVRNVRDTLLNFNGRLICRTSCCHFVLASPFMTSRLLGGNHTSCFFPVRGTLHAPPDLTLASSALTSSWKRIESPLFNVKPQTGLSKRKFST